MDIITMYSVFFLTCVRVEKVFEYLGVFFVLFWVVFFLGGGVLHIWPNLDLSYHKDSFFTNGNNWSCSF